VKEIKEELPISFGKNGNFTEEKTRKRHLG